MEEMNDSQPFVIKGSHSTITACSLPTWVPENIVKQMNRYFGGRLMRELAALRGRPDLLRNRTQSTGSRGASISSFDLSPGDSAVERFQDLLL